MNTQYLISICIPSYNRPSELKRLLDSIDTNYVKEVQIVVCEDMAPKRVDVNKVVNKFIQSSKYVLKYIENPENYGHGRNMRECINQAEGEYIMFMGDDDVFIPNAFDSFFDFVKRNRHIGYFLRSYAGLDGNTKEYFRYFKDNKFFEPGPKSYIEHFTKSISMSGFTIKRKYVKNYTLDIFDETLLYQLYLVAEVCINYPSAYCNIPFSYVIGDGKSYFGTNEKEKGKYDVGILVSESINFIIGRYKITEFIDKKYGLSSTLTIRKITSKYCFPILRDSRKYGRRHFLKQYKMFKKAKLDASIFFYIYYYSLLIMGIKFNVSIIRIIKMVVGRRLKL